MNRVETSAQRRYHRHERRIKDRGMKLELQRRVERRDRKHLRARLALEATEAIR